MSPFQAHGDRCVGQLCTLWQDWGTGGTEPEPERSGLWEMPTFASHSVGVFSKHSMVLVSSSYSTSDILVIDVRWCNWWCNWHSIFWVQITFICHSAVFWSLGFMGIFHGIPRIPWGAQGVFQMQSRTLLWCCTWQKALRKSKTKDAHRVIPEKPSFKYLNVIGILQIPLDSWLTSHGIPVVADTIPSPEAPHVSEQIGCHTKRHAASSRLQCRVAQDRDDSYGIYIYI